MALNWHEFYYAFLHQKKLNHQRNWIKDRLIYYAPNIHRDVTAIIGEKDKTKLRHECLNKIFNQQPKRDFFSFELFSNSCYFIKLLDILAKDQYFGVQTEPVSKLLNEN